MRPKDLFSILSRLESTLNEFSFEELNSEEAAHLKNSFEAFKSELYDKMNGLKESQVKPLKKTLSTPKSNEGGLIASVSHEIRTPLNGIIGFTDLLKESRLDKDQLANVNAIQFASFSLLELVNELLEYSKLASGEEQFQKVEFSLFGLVRDVMFLCNTLITNKKVTLNSTIGQGVPEFLMGDPSKLTQILLNLIGNAIKFVNKGEVNLNINLTSPDKQKFDLEFEIEDNGIGIAKDKLEQIFDPFKQADKDTASKYGGTGLGLSIVKQIVENLGGNIEVKSNIGLGSSFKFTMPLEKADQKPKPAIKSEEKFNSKDLKSIVGLNILVFEDNELNQRLIEQRLKIWKCHMHITDNPDYGMTVLENNDIDLVLMDLRMPIMSGFEVTKLIRNSDSPRIRQIPIIALTADYTIQDQEKCNSYGIDDYLLKPFSPEELLSKLLAYQKQGRRPIKKVEYKSESSAVDDLIDLSRLYSDSDRDTALLENLINLFKINITEFIANAEVRLIDQDAEALAFSAHKVKAGLVMVRAKSLTDTIIEIQKGCEEFPDWKHLNFLLARFMNEYPAVEKAIDRALSKMKEEEE